MSENGKQSPQPLMQQNDPLVQKLNKLSVKFNAKSMLEQEASEAISEYVNLAQQTIVALRKEVEDLPFLKKWKAKIPEKILTEGKPFRLK